MKITYLGQAGLMFEKDGFRFCVDPYLSDSCAKLPNPHARRVPVDPAYLAPIYDLIVFTHDHLDHTDPETYPYLLDREEPVTVLASPNSYERVRNMGFQHNYVRLTPGTTWTEHGIRFRGVYAEHSDPAAVGVIIDDGESVFYVTGDTLYQEKIFADLPEKIDAVFLPVNGVGNNMNFEDAKQFALRTGAKWVVPLHIGLFDDLTADNWDVPNKIIPRFFREISLG